MKIMFVLLLIFFFLRAAFTLVAPAMIVPHARYGQHYSHRRSVTYRRYRKTCVLGK